MSVLVQIPLFSWEKVDASPEIVRLGALLDALPDEALLRSLHAHRKGRHDEYPLRALWRSTVAGIVLGHKGPAELIRELRRNAELRQVCGFDPLRGEDAVPGDYVYSRFHALLIARIHLIQAMFAQLLDGVATLLSDLGKDQAIDSKALPVLGVRPKDADIGTKSYENDSADQEIRQWFGYKLHLLIDANYELPLAFEVTKASAADSPRLMPIIERLAAEHPEIHARAETLAADKGYDDGKDKEDLYDDHGIVPLIPPRAFPKNSAPMRPLDPRRHDAIYYNSKGEVSCKIAPFESEDAKAFAAMEFMGFERGRRTLKFRCPAAAFGIECRNREACRSSQRVREGKYGRVVRVPLDTNRRIFLPWHYPSRTFRHAYRKRTAVERVNSRLDNVHGFEHTYTRGLSRMTLRVSLVMIVMLATAVAWVEAGRIENIRRILRAA